MTLDLAVGGVLTTVYFWSESGWPADGWLDHARNGAESTVFVYDGAVRALRGTRIPELGGVTECSPGTGEEAKSWSGVERVLDAALARGLGRDGCVVGIGGGAVCDVSAFAASVYMRGVAVELVPTTLLAMVDASVGGKSAIDFRGYKNVVGTFHPARRIDVHLGSLLSLPPRELRSGLAEVLKTALLGDEELLELLARRREALLGRDLDLMGEIVRRSIAVKGSVVSADPKEGGERAILNLGHTFGHALEAVLGPGTISHGDAVAWGIDRAMELGLRLGHTAPPHRDRVRELLQGYGFALTLSGLCPPRAAVTPERLLAAMRMDKKKQGGGIRFVLQRGVGQTVLVEGVGEREILAVLSQEL